MRHGKHSIRFGRQRSHYHATLRHLVRGLILSKAISTTKTKAKQASRLMDKLITLGKEPTLAARRRAFSILHDRKLVVMLFSEIAPLFKSRNGGYTRVMLTNRRHGDNAQMAILELVEKPLPPKKEKKEGKKEKEKPVSEQGLKEKEEPKKEVKEKPQIKPEEVRHPKREMPLKPAKPQEKRGFFRKIFGKKKES